MPGLAVDTSPRVTETSLSASDRMRFPAVNVSFRSILSSQHARFSVTQFFTLKLQVFGDYLDGMSCLGFCCSSNPPDLILISGTKRPRALCFC